VKPEFVTSLPRNAWPGKVEFRGKFGENPTSQSL
jgi:hypothetical protein